MQKTTQNPGADNPRERKQRHLAQTKDDKASRRIQPRTKTYQKRVAQSASRTSAQTCWSVHFGLAKSETLRQHRNAEQSNIHTR